MILCSLKVGPLGTPDPDPTRPGTGTFWTPKSQKIETPGAETVFSDFFAIFGSKKIIYLFFGPKLRQLSNAHSLSLQKCLLRPAKASKD